MPSAKHLKVKERLILALRIKSSNKEANPCSYYYQQVRRYLIDLKESSRYSKYVYLKRSYNSSGLKAIPVMQKQVCRFFISLMPQRALVVDPPYTPYFPAFKLDLAFFKQTINPFFFSRGLPNFDPSNPFQAVFLFLRTSRVLSSYSIGFPLVPIYYLLCYTLSI